jgi:hypothetical protein
MTCGPMKSVLRGITWEDPPISESVRIETSILSIFAFHVSSVLGCIRVSLDH